MVATVVKITGITLRKGDGAVCGMSGNGVQSFGSMQNDLGSRMTALIITVRMRDRSLPLAWLAEAGAAYRSWQTKKSIS